ncbi:MAG TPA: AAC(3) family N-acetyltransferase, partial [Natronoarchaeum rubrum]|nr:AAC(3) family N-acetyltransferase [Natronoarchaeum rubrum]
PERITLEHLSYDADDFAEVGSDFEKARPEAVTEGAVGPADATLVSQRAAVDYGVEWFEENRA